MANKDTIRQEIHDAERELQALLEERQGLNPRRAEAVEKDKSALSEAHARYVRGDLDKRPVGYFEHRAGVEARAQAIPVEIDQAQLRLAVARLALVTLERSERLAAERAPKERLERIKQEASQIREEERLADQEVTNARRATEAKQQEEFLLDQEVRHLEEAVNARVRVSPNHGVVAG